MKSRLASLPGDETKSLQSLGTKPRAVPGGASSLITEL